MLVSAYSRPAAAGLPLYSDDSNSKTATAAATTNKVHPTGANGIIVLKTATTYHWQAVCLLAIPTLLVCIALLIVRMGGVTMLAGMTYSECL